MPSVLGEGHEHDRRVEVRLGAEGFQPFRGEVDAAGHDIAAARLQPGQEPGELHRHELGLHPQAGCELVGEVDIEANRLVGVLSS